jgi:hypothetical protein
MCVGAAQPECKTWFDVSFAVVPGPIGDDGFSGAGVGAVRIRLARLGLGLVQVHMPIDEAGPDLAVVQVDAV